MPENKVFLPVNRKALRTPGLFLEPIETFARLGREMSFLDFNVRPRFSLFKIFSS
jgi:hypothetical protein